jgi:4-diphosphocytidyl-2-C-methyl-D-erythritol kinase
VPFVVQFQGFSVISKITLQTPAKINPVLEVLSKRPDGYHELALVFQAIGLFDELEFSREGTGIQFETTESPEPLAMDDSNLVVKATKLFLKEVLKGRADIRVRLKKRIPLAAGLGGGSSDAAATLLGLDLVFNAMTDPKVLEALAAQLGSDVPFFLKGGTALGRGRGEILTPWPPAPPVPLVLVKPRGGLSTPAVYQSGRAAFGTGKRAEVFQSLLHEKNLSKIAGSLFNSLQPAAFYLAPEVETLHKQLLAAGALGALVSGSGPTVFAIAENPGAAKRIAAQMEGEGRFVLATHTVATGIQVLEKK